MAKKSKTAKAVDEMAKKLTPAVMEAAAKEPAPVEEPKAEEAKPAEPSDFLMFVGGQFYTKENFIEEANAQGISKRLPSFHLPDDLQVGKSRIWLAAAGTRKADSEAVSQIFGYFIPSAIEFIAGPDGEKNFADIIAQLKTKAGVEFIKDISKEKPRKCGVRKVGGTYLAAKMVSDSPLTLTAEQPYKGGFFRGMMRFTPEQRAAVEKGEGLVTYVSDTCMGCFNAMLTSPDSAKRAARERNRIAKGEEAKWHLFCPVCTEKEREAKKAEKAKAAEAAPAVDAEVSKAEVV